MANDELKDCWSQCLFFFVFFFQCHPHNVIYQAATTFNDFTLHLQATPDTMEYDLWRLLCKMIVPVGSDLIAHTSSMMENDSFLSFILLPLQKVKFLFTGYSLCMFDVIIYFVVLVVEKSTAKL